MDLPSIQNVDFLNIDQALLVNITDGLPDEPKEFIKLMEALYNNGFERLPFAIKIDGTVLLLLKKGNARHDSLIDLMQIHYNIENRYEVFDKVRSLGALNTKALSQKSYYADECEVEVRIGNSNKYFWIETNSIRYKNQNVAVRSVEDLAFLHPGESIVIHFKEP